MDWRGGESDRLRSSTVSHGRVHVGDGRLPFWVRCNASTSFFAFAVEASFVTEIWRKGFDGIGDCFIGTSVGIEDPVIGRLAALGRLELNEGGAGGRLYVEGLASALAVHLLRSSGLSRRSPIPHKGGLAPRQIRRVLDYIEAHLTDELGLVELAALVELSPNYFGEAFRISTGRSPHRYVMERRIECARDLLRDEDWPIRDIAYAAGFRPEPFHGELPPSNRGYARPIPPIASLRPSPAVPSAAALLGHPLGRGRWLDIVCDTLAGIRQIIPLPAQTATGWHFWQA